MPIVYMLFGLIYLFGTAFYAIARGGTAERAGAAVILIASVMSPVAAKSFSPTWHSVEPARLAVEVSTLFGLGAIAMLSDKFWPLWATSFQIFPTLVHLLKFAGASVTPYVFSHTTVPWYYPIMLMIVIGAANQQPPPRSWLRLSGALQPVKRTPSPPV